MLTDKFIKSAAPGMHADGGGLYLRVLASGKKVWVRRARAGGADKWSTLGHYPKLSLAEARRAISGTDVPGTQAVEMYLSKLQVRRPEQVQRLLAPLTTPKAVNTHTRQDLVATLQAKAATSPVMANRMLTRWKDFFNFCEQQGWVAANPLSIVQRRFIGGREHSRSRTLSWAEIKALLKAPPIPNPIPLYAVLVTGLRPSEAIWAIRSAKTSNIPTKTVPHTLPRSHLIRFVLKKAANVAAPASHLTVSNALRRSGADYTPHDLRRTFASRLSDLGVLPHVVEKMLNHKMTGVMAVYNHAEYWPERHAAQRLWDKKLLSLWREE